MEHTTHASHSVSFFLLLQTGTGKTFTLSGGVDSYSQRGLTPRSLELLFAERDKLHATGAASVQVSVSYLEIYNETVYDLLGSPAADAPLDLAGPNLPRVTLLESDDGSLAFRNLSCHVADSCEEALGLLFQGDTARAVAETSSNATSSRSHCVFTAYVEVRPAGSDVIRKAKLHLVDLAGSERIGKSGTTDVGLLSESKHINLSLSYLEQVIVALQEKAVGLGRHHIPYRNSCLTSVLRDSLGGNARTSMVATLAPVSAALEEGVSTCRFAQRVAMITNNVVKNESIDPELVIKRLKQQVRDLKAELRLARDATAADGGDGDADDDALGVDEQRRLREAAHKFVADGSESSAVPHTAGRLSVVNFLFRALKDIARAAAQQADGAAAVKAHVAQRDAEIGALLGVLLKTDAALCTPGGDGDAASRGAPALQVHPLRLPDEVAAPAFGASFAAVMAARADAGFSDLAPATGLADAMAVRAAAFSAFTRSAVARTHTLGSLASELKAAQAEAQHLADVANAARQGIQASSDEAKQRAAQRAQSAVAAALAGPAAEAAWKLTAAEAERKGLAAIEQHKGEYRAASAALEDVKRRMWDMHRAMEAATVAANEDLAFWARAVGGGADAARVSSSQATGERASSSGAGSAHGEVSGGGDGGLAPAMAELALPTPPPPPPLDVSIPASPPLASLAPVEQQNSYSGAAAGGGEDPPELAAMLTGDPDTDADIRAFYAATSRRQ